MASDSPKAPIPPSPYVILGAYIFLGTILSFAFGREPGTMPDNLIKEVSPTLIVISVFMVTYSLWDVMAVGVSKQNFGILGKRHADIPVKWPEEVYLAQRVQTNQVEQLPVFIIGSIGCAVVVNGKVAGILASVWVILRRMYAWTYRSATGKTFDEIGLSRFTVPAYFASNVPLMATMVHSIRCLLTVE